VNLDEISGVIVNFLNEANGVFVRINYFNISAPSKIAAGTFTPVATASVSERFPIGKLTFILPPRSYSRLSAKLRAKFALDGFGDALVDGGHFIVLKRALVGLVGQVVGEALVAFGNR